MCIKIKKPSECNEEEINNFLQKVKKGEEVNRYGLRKRIERAKLLAFQYKNNILVGIAAIKQPYKTYTKSVFEKAGVPEKFNNFKLEMGWAFTEPEYRGNHVCSNLTKELISIFELQNIFATTRTDNVSMQKILLGNGFQKIGNSYLGRTGCNRIQLFMLSVRDNFMKNEC